MSQKSADITNIAAEALNHGKLASPRTQNGKQGLTKSSTIVPTPWKKGYRPPTKKMERIRSSESE
jgi:hypothetical protein